MEINIITCFRNVLKEIYQQTLGLVGCHGVTNGLSQTNNTGNRAKSGVGATDPHGHNPLNTVHKGGSSIIFQMVGGGGRGAKRLCIPWGPV